MQEIVLTTSYVARFSGGQLRIENRNEGYVICGLVEKISVENGLLSVEFEWLARGVGGLPPLGWVKKPNQRYSIHVSACHVNDLGDGLLVMFCPPKGDFATFFPPRKGCLDPKQVQGLEIAV